MSYLRVKKIALCLLWSISLAASLTWADTPPPVVEKMPTLTIGTLMFNPPFETADTKRNIYSGFEIDMMNAVCQRLKWQCQYQAFTTIKDVSTQLLLGKVQVVVASIVVLKGDGEHLFSTPYLPSGIQFFAKKDSKISTMDDILQSKIGTVNDPLIKTIVAVNYARDLPISVYDTPQAGIEDLDNGKIDVFVMQTAAVKYWLSITSGAFKLIGDSHPIGLGNGAMVMNTQKALIDQINQALLAMENDGTYSQIYNRYVFL